MTTEWNPDLNWQSTQIKTDNTMQNNGGSLTPNNQGNPGAVLDKDAFLKLFLIEMQRQDPIDPMDSDRILTQISQLAAFEMQRNTNNTMQQMVAQMEKLSDAMGTSQNIDALGAIDRMATIADNKIKLTGPDEVIALKMYLPEASNKDGITLGVYDRDNKLVYTEEVSEDKEVSAGHFTMEWPGRNNDGVYAGDGEYMVKIIYNNQ